MLQFMNPIIDDLNAALAAHGLKIVMITPPAIGIPNARSEHVENHPNPHPNADWNDFPTVPKDYPEHPKEGATPPINPDIERKKNRLAALMNRR